MAALSLEQIVDEHVDQAVATVLFDMAAQNSLIFNDFYFEIPTNEIILKHCFRLGDYRQHVITQSL